MTEACILLHVHGVCNHTVDQFSTIFFMHSCIHSTFILPIWLPRLPWKVHSAIKQYKTKIKHNNPHTKITSKQLNLILKRQDGRTDDINYEKLLRYDGVISRKACLKSHVFNHYIEVYLRRPFTRLCMIRMYSIFLYIDKNINFY